MVQLEPIPPVRIEQPVADRPEGIKARIGLNAESVFQIMKFAIVADCAAICSSKPPQSFQPPVKSTVDSIDDQIVDDRTIEDVDNAANHESKEHEKYPSAAK